MTSSRDRTPRKPRLHFSIKALLLLTAGVACFFAGRVSALRSLQRVEAEAARQQALAEANFRRAQQAVDAMLVQQAKATLRIRSVQAEKELQQRALRHHE